MMSGRLVSQHKQMDPHKSVLAYLHNLWKSILSDLMQGTFCPHSGVCAIIYGYMDMWGQKRQRLCRPTNCLSTQFDLKHHVKY